MDPIQTVPVERKSTVYPKKVRRWGKESGGKFNEQQNVSALAILRCKKFYAQGDL
jgi:hypothetical protein